MKKDTATKAKNSNSAPTTSAETSSNTATDTTEAPASTGGANSAVFGIIGLVLGLIVGFAFTNSLNGTPPNGPGMSNSAMTGKAGPLKGNESMPANHPNVSDVNIEEEVKMALKYGQENQDYDAQLKVASYLYVQAHKLKEAKPFLLKAHELKPAEYEPIVQLGNLTFDLAQETNDSKLMPEATDWYEKALKIKPDDTSVRTDYGLTFQLREIPLYEKALEQYEKTLAIDPKHTVALYNKTRALLGMKKVAEAEAVFAQIKDNNGQPELIKRLEEELAAAKTGSKTVPIPTH